MALTVERGELVAVLGPNGSGKSTLLRCIAGLLPIDAGSIEVDGDGARRGVDRSLRPPERRPIGVVFQDYLLFAHLSALENVAFGLRARGTAKGAAHDAARTWLGRVGLADHAEHRPGELSGGQAQRVALARALATDPPCCCSTNHWPPSMPAPAAPSAAICAATSSRSTGCG